MICKNLVALFFFMQFIQTAIRADDSIAEIPSMSVIDHCCTEIGQRRFVIVIASFNNEKYVHWNLASALNQRYDNYRIIYHDDCSLDRTFELVQEIAGQHPKGHLITCVRNDIRRWALENLYETITQRCEDDEIVVLLDGDDALAHENVLRILNYVYNYPLLEIWLTYGQFKEINSGNIGFCSPMPTHVRANNSFREWVHAPSHLRSFYTWLFKLIKKEDLLYEGKFIKVPYDLAIMFPMIEMARSHFQFIPEVLYLYTDTNPISDHRAFEYWQLKFAEYIRKLPRYKPLSARPIRLH